jgi:hypothetical protein
MEQLTLDKKGFEQFTQAYLDAVKNKSETFTFEGHLILTQYAKYLIELNNYDTKRKSARFAR